MIEVIAVSGATVTRTAILFAPVSISYVRLPCKKVLVIVAVNPDKKEHIIIFVVAVGVIAVCINLFLIEPVPALIPVRSAPVFRL